MEAMILAAGAGTRLRPLTDQVPKALVQVGGRSLLEWVLDRLVAAGVDRVIVNAHYHEEQIRAFLKQMAPRGVDLAISPEPGGPFDTGGGLFAAAHLFKEAGPFLLHNVDVISRIPLDELIAGHTSAQQRSPAQLVASLAVQQREANRRLLFDDLGLVGWENRGREGALPGSRQVREPEGELRRYSFTGIHVVEPKVFDLSDRTGAFSIVTLYLELAAQGYVVRPVDMSGHDWVDVGTPQRLSEADRVVRGRTPG
ncbi:MAG: nucleotidyltransferase family protein [Gemmatimonadota bacterium]|nr:MAG: nucleotidyltransferase family protein [Gemmatimonadota bacterium]